MIDPELAGHRKRMKDRFRKYGFLAFDETEKLEFLLFFCQPFKDTRPFAKQLLDSYDSIRGLLDIDYRFLRAHPGVGDNTAIFFNLMRQFVAYLLNRTKPVVSFKNSDSFETFLKRRFDMKDREMLMALALDDSGSLIQAEILSEGTITHTSANIRTIMNFALEFKAASLVVAHNHPSGVCRPSEDDDLLTQNLRDSLAHIQVDLVDHIIFAEDRIYSYLREGRLCPEQTGRASFYQNSKENDYA